MHLCPNCKARMIADFDKSIGVFWRCVNCQYECQFGKENERLEIEYGEEEE